MRNKALRTVFLLSFMIFAVSFMGFSKEKAIESIWATSVKIDGSSNDWAEGSLNYWKKTEADYGFKNDANNLYVFFVFKDPKYLSSIKSTGMTLWFNTEGKNKKEYGINFKMTQVTADQLISILEKQQGPLTEAKKKELRFRKFYRFYQGEIIDKKGNILTDAALEGRKEVPIFRLNPQKKMTAYEFKIPLRILEKLSPDLAMEPGKMVKIGFEWGGLTEELKKQRMAQQGAQSSRGAETQAKTSTEESGLKSERREREARTPDLASIRRYVKKYSFWVDVKLAQKK